MPNTPVVFQYGAVNPSPTNPGNAAAADSVKGVTNGSSAAAGMVGEIITSGPVSGNMPATDTYGDATSIVLTPGDWEIWYVLQINSGANIVWGAAAITTHAGNDTTGTVQGDNKFAVYNNTYTATCTVLINVNITSNTTYYGKMQTNYSGSIPTYNCRMSARRRR